MIQGTPTPNTHKRLPHTHKRPPHTPTQMTLHTHTQRKKRKIIMPKTETEEQTKSNNIKKV